MLLATLKKIRKEGPDRNPKDPSTDDESCRHAQPVQGRGGGGEERKSWCKEDSNWRATSEREPPTLKRA